MLTFARSGQSVEIEEFSVAGIIESLELLVKASMQERNVRLTWQVDGVCNCLCDRDGVSQAGLNLILNAAEAANGNPDPHILIAAACDSDWVYIAVEDNGPGVPEKLRDSVFTAFFTTKPFDKGTGLGLSVSRQLIRAGGGELTLSEKNSSLGGAEFVIRLPRTPCPECMDGTSSNENPDS